jgi:carbon monoxide dehydrogenase subunit G
LKITNSFEVPLPIAAAWVVLTDIERIAPCLPGAELTEVVGDSSYRGKVSVRLGPVALSFKGTARFEEADAAAYRARVKASGSDSKGRGGAEADVTFSLEPGEGGTRVLVETDLRLSGSVAQYGRGAGMVSDLASHLVGQFAECLKTQLAEQGAGQEPVKAARPAEPVPGLSLGLRVLWNAFLRAIRRLFGSGSNSPQA